VELETVDEEPEVQAPVSVSQAKTTAKEDAPVAVSKRSKSKSKKSKSPADKPPSAHVMALYEPSET